MSERRVGTRSPCPDIDVANVPMIASFERAEWARFATRREYGVGLHWFLASSPRSEATGELYNPARLVRSSALTSASGRRSPPSTSKTSTDSSPPSRALWASSWVISRQEGEPCNASTAPASSQIVSVPHGLRLAAGRAPREARVVCGASAGTTLARNAGTPPCAPGRSWRATRALSPPLLRVRHHRSSGAVS